MACFDTGISEYVHAIAKVDVYFPVDSRGNAYCCCNQCFFFREASKSCALNHEVCAFPNKYVGGSCPLMSVSDEQHERIIKVLSDIAIENAKYE